MANGAGNGRVPGNHLETVLYKRFLWGMNQLVIWRT